MNTQVIKQSLHQLIDQIEDNELLFLYQQLLERELKKSASTDFLKNSEDDLISRARASLQSIEEGRTRSIEEFKKDVEKWKEKRVM